MIDKEKLEECWIDAIDHCEDRIAGVLPVYKNFQEWYDDNVASDGVLADVSDSHFTEFCCYVTGHDEATISQMYQDWKRYR